MDNMLIICQYVIKYRVSFNADTGNFIFRNFNTWPFSTCFLFLLLLGFSSSGSAILAFWLLAIRETLSSYPIVSKVLLEGTKQATQKDKTCNRVTELNTVDWENNLYSNNLYSTFKYDSETSINERNSWRLPTRISCGVSCLFCYFYMANIVTMSRYINSLVI